MIIINKPIDYDLIEWLIDWWLEPIDVETMHDPNITHGLQIYSIHSIDYSNTYCQAPAITVVFNKELIYCWPLPVIVIIH